MADRETFDEIMDRSGLPRLRVSSGALRSFRALPDFSPEQLTADERRVIAESLQRIAVTHGRAFVGRRLSQQQLNKGLALAARRLTALSDEDRSAAMAEMLAGCPCLNPFPRP